MMGLPKSKQPNSENKSFARLKSAISDPLMKTKFKFFASTGQALNSCFLVKFQTNNPMVPFLAQSLEEIIRLFGSAFLLKETLSKVNSCLLLSKVDFTNPTFHKRPVDVDPRIGVKLELLHLRNSGKISDNQVLSFKREVSSFLSKLCSHLGEKSPIKQSLTRNARCFIPSLLIENPEVCTKRFKRVLENLVSTKQIADRFAEEASQQFPKFLNVAKENGQEFQEFDPSSKDHRLDTFYWKHIEGVKSVEKVAEVLKIILTVSHGQASVERGFSVNSSLLVENLSAKSLILNASFMIIWQKINHHLWEASQKCSRCPIKIRVIS